MSESLKEVPIWVIAFLISGAFHEFAHAWSAFRLGDSTAQMEGRLTVNPIPHIDPTGLIFLIIMAASGMGIGWMKPVPVNLYNLRNPRRDFMLISLAGPVSNIILAVPFAVIIHLWPYLVTGGTPIGKLVEVFLMINVLLAAFNIIPVYPLDGSKVVAGLLPDRFADQWEKTYNFGWWILIALMFTGMLRLVMYPIMNFILTILGFG